MHKGLHARYPLFLSYFIGALIFWTYFQKIFQIASFMKICSVGVEMFHAEERKDERTEQSRLKQSAEQFAQSCIKLLVLFKIRRNCLRSGRSRSLCLLIRRAIKQIVLITGAHQFLSTTYKFYPTSSCQSYLHK